MRLIGAGKGAEAADSGRSRQTGSASATTINKNRTTLLDEMTLILNESWINDTGAAFQISNHRK